MPSMTENPDVTGIVLPVYIPSDNGELKLEIADAELFNGKLVVSFNDRLPAAAIQRMIAKGEIFGLALVKIDVEDESAN